MTAQDKATIKSYFVSGARPNENQFGDLADSYQDFHTFLNYLATAASTEDGIWIVSGSTVSGTAVLPIHRGGTGAQSVASARQSLGIVSAEELTGVAFVASANVFTNTQTIISSATDANEGPAWDLDRRSDSAADGDKLGVIRYKGRDSLGASTTYAKIRGGIVSTSASNENGVLELITTVSGNSAVRFNIGGGFYSENSTDQGIDTISVPVSGGYYHGSTRIPIGQVVFTAESTQLSISDVIPSDNTTPLSTEGSAILSESFTPIHPNSMLEIEFHCFVGNNTNSVNTLALFKDSGASAIYATGADIGSSGGDAVDLNGHVFVSASSTTSRTYVIRAGPAAGTMTVNRFTSTGAYGGATSMVLKITEHLP